MRVADRSTIRNYLSQLNQAKSDYMTTQAQIYSGNRYTMFSDDVSSSVRVMNTRYELYTAETQHSNITAVNDELTIAEDALMSIEDILTSAHELALTALNADKISDGDILASEIASLKEQILLFANTKVGSSFTLGGSNASVSEPFTIGENGEFLYNGIDVSTVMVADGTVEGFDKGDYYYMNDAGEATKIPMDEDVYIDIGLGVTLNESQVTNSSALKISFSGLDIFGFGVDEESGHSNNIYNILTELENSILEGDLDGMSTADNHLLELTDNFLTHITDIGAKTNYLDTAELRLERNIDMYKITIDNLMGTNDEEAITTLAMNEYVLQAIMQMGSTILPNTLMDFVR